MNIFIKSFVLVGSLLSTEIIQGMLPEKEKVKEHQPQEYLVNDIKRYILYLYLNETLDYNFSPYKSISSLNDNTFFTRAALSPDEKTILMGSDKTACLCDVETGDQLHEFTDPTDYIKNVAFSPDGKTALTSSTGGMVRLWDVETGKLLKECQNSGSLFSVVFSLDGTTILAEGGEGYSVWDVKSGELLTLFTRKDYSEFAQVTNADGEKTSFYRDDTVLANYLHVWNARNMRQLSVRMSPEASYVESVAFNSDESMIMVMFCAKDKRSYTIQLYETRTGNLLKTFTYPATGFDIYLTRFSPDGHMVMFFTGIGGNYTLQLVDIQAEKLLKEFPFTGYISLVTFSKDGSMITVCAGKEIVILKRLSSSNEWMKTRKESAFSLYKEKLLYLLLDKDEEKANKLLSIALSSSKPIVEGSIQNSNDQKASSSSSTRESKEDLEKDAPKECVIQ